MTKSITTLSIMTLTITTISIMTLSIMTLSITTHSIRTQKHNDTQHNDTQHHDTQHKGEALGLIFKKLIMNFIQSRFESGSLITKVFRTFVLVSYSQGTFTLIMLGELP